MPKISVIILNYNGQRHLQELLGKCVESVLLTDYPNFEVLFIDNASTDSSVDIIKSRFGKDERLKVIQNRKNLGFAEGNNVGLRIAQGEYIALLNSDTKVDSCWLKTLVKAIEPSDVGAAQSKLLLMSKPSLMDCAGGLVDYYGYHIEKGRGEAASHYTKNSEIFYGKGASLILKREALKKAGLFDKDIFMYYDETDLCWRIRLAGYKVVFAPASIVFHASGLTTAKVYDQKKLFFAQRNHLMIVIKNFELNNMFKAVSVSIIYEIRNALLFILRRKTLASLAILKALFWNLFNLRKTWKKRLDVQKSVRQVSDETIKCIMLPPYPPFPLYLVFPRNRYFKNAKNLLNKKSVNNLD
ncbi:MAG: glycosyltransferase family 2 protein [Candidatus Bathyarchaeia archaeon]|jgi:GT2 family glycosyltransferase